MNALMIDQKDTVAVAVEMIEKGSEAVFFNNGEEERVIVLEDITIYHKFAIKDMKKGTAVVKYGEHIGLAARDIKVGEHVHVHNVESHREDL